MANMAIDPGPIQGTPSVEQRAAPRFTALIRTAKLVSAQGEFVCVLRDVSSTGVRLRCFHPLPADDTIALELPTGDLIELRKVREDGLEASFAFVTPVPVETLVHVNSDYPRRPLRLAIALPVTLRTLTGAISAVTQNISQQGCRVQAALPLALAQSVVIDSPNLPEIRAKVRWRRDGSLGMVFDDTFSLQDFAVHTARLQCPALFSAQANKRTPG